jgi:predicted O-methyltransferase YrrM
VKRKFKKAIVYFTDSRLEETLDEAVRKNILYACSDIPIISVSQKKLNFGENICIGIRARSYLRLYRQLLRGLEAIDDDAIVYVCEHDVFYHPSHFDFIPPRQGRIYFNKNRYYTQNGINHFTKAIGTRALSQAVAYKPVLISHAKEQVSARIDGIASPCIGPFDNFESKYPNIDVRHGGNFSNSDRFNEKEHRYYKIDGWGTVRMFRETIGYKVGEIHTPYHLHNIFNSDNKENPVEVKQFYRKYLPGLWHSLGFKKGAEIGVKRGIFSHEICKSMPDGVQLKCIDPYHPGPNVAWDEAEKFFVIAKHLLKDYDAQIIKKTSMQAADEDVPKWSLDFVYIDADHSFDNVIQDIIVWSDRVRPGGIVSGHDYDNEEVKTAVDAYVKVHGHELFITQKGTEYPEAHPSWFFAKGRK